MTQVAEPGSARTDHADAGSGQPLDRWLRVVAGTSSREGPGYDPRPHV